MTGPLHIAFVSHEFPPDTGGGGIGTYLDQMVRLLSEAGHEVHVFCGARTTAGESIRPDRTHVHRLAATSAEEFRATVVPAFSQAHAQRAFDLVETNDFDAPGNALKRAFPAMPCVLKLHTPRFVIDELHARPLTQSQRWRMALGALRRGRWPQSSSPIRASAAAREELAALRLADEIAAPSQAVAESARQWDPRVADRISVYPYPYAPAPELLAIPPGGTTGRITFLGRLEERKGVIDLADAIPGVLAACPDARFRFVGRAMPSPREGQDMQAFLIGRLGRAADAVEFTGPVPPTDLPRILAETDLLVAPSHWESFGLVCCEGLAAARAVVGSNHGGMVEILDGGNCGVLVAPHRPTELAAALIRLHGDNALRRQLGEAGRQRILGHYSPQRVLAQQLASYQAAIRRCRALPSSRHE